MEHIENRTRQLEQDLENLGKSITLRIVKESLMSDLFRGEITPLSSSYNIPGLVPVCWLLFQCF